MYIESKIESRFGNDGSNLVLFILYSWLSQYFHGNDFIPQKYEERTATTKENVNVG